MTDELMVRCALAWHNWEDCASTRIAVAMIFKEQHDFKDAIRRMVDTITGTHYITGFNEGWRTREGYGIVYRI